MINRDVVIVYNKFLCQFGETRVVGGIETYLHYLAKLLANYTTGNVIIIQPASIEFDVRIDNYNVVGHVFSKSHKKIVCKHALSLAVQKKSILIFAADQYSIKTDYKYAISIMHGISWDLPASFFTRNGGVAGFLGKIPFIGPLLAKKYVIFQRLSDIQNCNNNVLVDFNSINWYRTQFTNNIPFNYQVILNFAAGTNKEPDFTRHFDNKVSILFARRFQEYRGLSLVVDVAKQIISEFNNVEFCFAGEGPDEQMIRNEFPGESRITITKYDCNESIDFHQKYHITIVPSLGSEGSSLSLAEAMFAGCSVVASDVGGMTNMVLHEFNGILIPPKKTELLGALRSLIVDPIKRISLAENAHKTAKAAFSFSRWEEQWLKLIFKVDSQ